MHPLKNRMILYNIGHITWLIGIYYFLGMRTVIFHLFYSFVIVLIFEAINYLEHYGLERKKDSNGNYEPIGIKHSFNAPHSLTNMLLFKL